MPACAHFLSKKGRPCGQPTRGEDALCGPHSGSYSASCTSCGTSLHPRAASAHASKCPRARADAKVFASEWFRKFANRPPLTVCAPETPRTFEEAIQLLSAMMEYVDEPPERSPQELAEASVIRARWAHPRTSYARLEARHFAQVAALASLALADTAGDGLAVAELGAGRAYTSLYLAEALQMRGKMARFLAVDRGANRNKMDGVLRTMAGRGEGVTEFTRARVDIAHLWLFGASGFAQASNPRIVGKHVCGAAADAALRAVDEFCRRWRIGRQSGECRAVIAPCCRSACEWASTHSIAEFWTRMCGVGEDVYRLIVNRASWGLNPDEPDLEKVRVGHVCRSAVDGARVKWMRSQGWDVKMVRYVASDVTAENIAVVASWRIG